MTPTLEIIIIGCLVASAAAIPGTFLILRQVAMLSDAISHAVLLGIVIMFLIVKNLHSPLLMIAATITGLITVAITEWFIHSKKMKKDAAIGLVFPVFFALAIILINLKASNIHLDQDAVLLGEIAFAPFNRFVIRNIDLGPIGLWVMGIILIINCLFTKIFYKELKLSTFDQQLAKSLGFKPLFIHYGLMTCVSFTTVGAFDIVGAILIVALIITPPATAYLLTKKVSHMLLLSILIGCASTISGYFLAQMINGSIAGAMCTMAGVIFIITLFFSPRTGLLHQFYTHKKQKTEFSAALLMVQLYDHEDSKEVIFESSYTNIIDHMKWKENHAKKTLTYAISHKMIISKNQYYELTNFGREIAKASIERT